MKIVDGERQLWGGLRPEESGSSRIAIPPLASEKWIVKGRDEFGTVEKKGQGKPFLKPFLLSHFSIAQKLFCEGFSP